MTVPAKDDTREAAPGTTSGKRFAIALGSWCFAGVGVLSSIMFLGAALTSKNISAGSALSIAPFIAWVALAVMTVRWLQARRCHWVWLVLGTLAGIVSAAAFIGVFYIYVSAVPLATYLVFWHIQQFVRGKGAA